MEKKKKKKRSGEEHELEAYQEPFLFFHGSSGFIFNWITRSSRMTREERGEGFVLERVVKFSAESLTRLKRVLIRN